VDAFDCRFGRCEFCFVDQVRDALANINATLRITKVHVATPEVASTKHELNLEIAMLRNCRRNVESAVGSERRQQIRRQRPVSKIDAWSSTLNVLELRTLISEDRSQKRVHSRTSRHPALRTWRTRSQTRSQSNTSQ